MPGDKTVNDKKIKINRGCLQPMVAKIVPEKAIEGINKKRSPKVDPIRTIKFETRENEIKKKKRQKRGG